MKTAPQTFLPHFIANRVPRSRHLYTRYCCSIRRIRHNLKRFSDLRRLAKQIFLVLLGLVMQRNVKALKTRSWGKQTTRACRQVNRQVGSNGIRISHTSRHEHVDSRHRVPVLSLTFGSAVDFQRTTCMFVSRPKRGRDETQISTGRRPPQKKRSYPSNATSTHVFPASRARRAINDNNM